MGDSSGFRVNGQQARPAAPAAACRADGPPAPGVLSGGATDGCDQEFQAPVVQAGEGVAQGDRDAFGDAGELEAALFPAAEADLPVVQAAERPASAERARPIPGWSVDWLAGAAYARSGHCRRAAARGRSGSWTATRGGRPGNVPACAAAQTAICWAACLPGEKPDGEPRSEHRGELRPRGGGDLRRDDDPGAHDRWVVLRDGASRPGRVLPAPCHPRPVPRAAQSKTRRPPPMSDCCPAAAGNSSAPLSRGSAYRAVRRASW